MRTIDSNGQNIPIQIRGQPLFTGQGKDTYYFVDSEDNNVHPPPPQLWLCRDTHFVVSTEGVRYEPFVTPEGSQTAN